jgi:hypothetical protein
MTMTKKRTAGRPAGSKEWIAIDLPDGDRLVPYFTTFSQGTGLHTKYCRRRPRSPATGIGSNVVVLSQNGNYGILPASGRCFTLP